MAPTRRSKTDSSIIRQGEELVALLSDNDSASLEKLDAFIEAFSVWEKDWASRVASTPKDKELAAIGREVAVLHGEVLRLAGLMKESIGTSLRSLRKKGKGLIAYADHLPKRISTIRTRKG